MSRSSHALTVSLALALVLLPAGAWAEGVRPGSLLVYYGYPTSINATWSVTGAAQEFGRYDIVVWGDGLDNPAHPDHANAVAILAHPATAATRIHGYVDLGVTTQNLSLAEIQVRIGRWDAMGVAGVLLDDFGYDFGTDRARQNAAVDFAHARGLSVIANAFRPGDAFGSVVDPLHNPAGLPTSLGPADHYLYESHGVRLGEFEDAALWRERSDAVEGFRQALGFRVLSVTTTATDGPQAYDESAFHYAWYAALLCGHEATGWGEYGFSAYGASNGVAPFHARPTLAPGTSFVSPVLHAGALHTRHTDVGRIELDTATHRYGFSPASLAVPGEPAPGGRALVAIPNPARVATRFRFTLARPQHVRLRVYDASGRRVATFASGERGAGPHEMPWAGLDDAGRRVAAGSYFAVLESGDGRSVLRFVFER